MTKTHPAESSTTWSTGLPAPWALRALPWDRPQRRCVTDTHQSTHAQGSLHSRLCRNGFPQPSRTRKPAFLKNKFSRSRRQPYCCTSPEKAHGPEVHTRVSGGSDRESRGNPGTATVRCWRTRVRTSDAQAGPPPAAVRTQSNRNPLPNKSDTHLPQGPEEVRLLTPKKWKHTCV